MVTEELLSYIKRERALGLSDESIQKVLLLHGWKEADVTQAFTMVLAARPAFTPKAQAPAQAQQPALRALPQELSPLSASIEAEPIVIPPFAERVQKAVVINPISVPASAPAQPTPIQPVIKQAAIEPISPMASPVMPINPVQPVKEPVVQNPTPVAQPQPRIEHAPLSAPIQPARPSPVVAPVSPQNNPSPLSTLSPLSNPRPQALSDSESIREAQAKVFQAQPQTFASNRPVTVMPVKKPRRGLKVLIALLILAAAGAGAYFYFNSSKQVLKKAVVATLATSTLEYSLEGDVVSGDSSGTPTSTHVSARGMSDTSSSIPKISTSLMATIEGASVGAELRDIGGMRYVQLNALPQTEEGELPLFLNKWIKLDTSAVPETLPASLSVFRDIVSELRIRDMIGSLGDFSFLAVTQTLPDEQINDMLMSRVAVGIEKNSFEAALSSMPASFLTTISNVSGSLWIGKTDGLIHRAEFNFKTSATSPTSKIILVLSNFNSPVQISEPSPYQSLTEVLGTMNGVPSAGSALPPPPSTVSQNDGGIKDALTNIIAKGKLYFGIRHGYKYICGNADVGIADDIKGMKAAYADSNPICHDAISGFAVSAELSTAGSYWCVDSTGAAKEMTSPVLSTVCQ